MSARPLEDVSVLDLSRLLPGPYATLVLADLGAKVDKLEPPSGDETRAMGARVGGEGAYFYGLNRNKRSIVLDLKRPEAAQAVLRMIRRYDVLVESFRPGVMERFGLSYETLRKENPRIVYCAMTGYGQTGPDRLKAGHDLDYAARSGVLGYGGAPPGPPVMPGVQIADIGGALCAVAGILAALHARERTGEGRIVDISLTESALPFLHLHLAARLAAGDEGRPLARGQELLNGGLPGYSIYETADGRALAVGALEPKFLSALLEKLGRPELLGDAFLIGDKAERVRAELKTLFRSRPMADWRGFFEGTDFCVEPIHEGDEVLGDAHLRARGVFLEAKDPERGIRVTHLRTPLATEGLPIRPPPSLGGHTEEILAEAGLSPEEIAALRST